MARLNKAVLLAAAAVAAVALMMAAGASAAVTCGQVGNSIGQCIAYVTGKAAALPKPCCDGVKSLNGMARTAADRQAACRCLKKLAGSIKSLNLGTVAGVPGKCGVSVPFPISMSTDCDKVK